MNCVEMKYCNRSWASHTSIRYKLRRTKTKLVISQGFHHAGKSRRRREVGPLSWKLCCSLLNCPLTSLRPNTILRYWKIEVRPSQVNANKRPGRTSFFAGYNEHHAAAKFSDAVEPTFQPRVHIGTNRHNLSVAAELMLRY